MNKASAFVIYSIVFFAFFDLFAQLPVMSTFATSVGATPFIAGLVIAIYSLSNTFGNILSGIWTDRIGPIVICSLVLRCRASVSCRIISSTQRRRY